MDRPNILLITSDQQHWDTLSCLGSQVATPNLDRLAARGTLFERAYCPNPTCTPTRASIITGQYPSQHGAYSLGTKLMEDRHTVGEDLMAGGWWTGLVGKAHFQQLYSEGYDSVESYPLLQDLEFWRHFNQRHVPWYGFQHVELARNHVDEAHVGQHYALWMEEQGLADWRRYFKAPTGTVTEQQFGAWDLPECYHYNTWISQRSCALMEQAQAAGQPFFLWSSFFDPHPGYLVPEPWASMYDPASLTVPDLVPGEHAANPDHFAWTQDPKADWSTLRDDPEGSFIHGCGHHNTSRDQAARNLAVYYGMISCMDHHIGVTLDRLEALGLANNTIIVFTTDHGHFLGQHGLHAKGPFHYEDMIRIPMIVSWPGQVPAGRRSSALQTLVDLAPTVLDCCNLTIPRCMTGHSQRTVWCGDETARRDHVICENRHQPHTLYARTCVWQRYKMTVYGRGDQGELWDLEKDPNELRNLWASPAHQDLKRDLLLRFLQAGMATEPLPMPRVCGA